MPTKAELQAEVTRLRAEIKARDDEVRSSVKAAEKSLETAKSATSQLSGMLQAKVASWLTIARGKRIAVEDIIGVEVIRDRVIYRLKGDPQLYGILTTEENTEKLVSPPVHEHEFKTVLEGGIRGVCSCGKSRKVA